MQTYLLNVDCIKAVMFLCTERKELHLRCCILFSHSFVLTVVRVLDKAVGAVEACCYTNVESKQCH